MFMGRAGCCSLSIAVKSRFGASCQFSHDAVEKMGSRGRVGSRVRGKGETTANSTVVHQNMRSEISQARRSKQCLSTPHQCTPQSEAPFRVERGSKRQRVRQQKSNNVRVPGEHCVGEQDPHSGDQSSSADGICLRMICLSSVQH